MTIKKLAEELQITDKAVYRRIRMLRNAGLMTVEVSPNGRIAELTPEQVQAITEYRERINGAESTAEPTAFEELTDRLNKTNTELEKSAEKITELTRSNEELTSINKSLIERCETLKNSLESAINERDEYKSRLDGVEDLKVDMTALRAENGNQAAEIGRLQTENGELRAAKDTQTITITALEDANNDLRESRDQWHTAFINEQRINALHQAALTDKRRHWWQFWIRKDDDNVDQG